MGFDGERREQGLIWRRERGDGASAVMYEVLWSLCVSVYVCVCGGAFMVRLRSASWGLHVSQLCVMYVFVC